MNFRRIELLDAEGQPFSAVELKQPDTDELADIAVYRGRCFALDAHTPGDGAFARYRESVTVRCDNLTDEPCEECSGTGMSLPFGDDPPIVCRCGVWPYVRLEKLEAELERTKGELLTSQEQHARSRESLRSSLDGLQARLDSCAESLGDWKHLGPVPGALPACIEFLRLTLETTQAERDELRINNAALGLMAVESLGKVAAAERELDAATTQITACREALRRGFGIAADESVLEAVEALIGALDRFRSRGDDAEAARDRAIEERTTIGVRATELTAKNHALREERERMKSVVWTLNNALATYHDFTSELLEAQRLASQVPGLYATDDGPEPEVIVEVKFEDRPSRDVVREMLDKSPAVNTSDRVPSL